MRSPRRLRIRAAAVALGVVGALAPLAPTPAAAEIDPAPRTWWGVDTLATGTTTDRISAEVWAIEQIDDVVYVGGKFTEIAHEQRRFDHAFLAAYDAATGVWIDSWRPRLDGPVYALQASADGERLFVGGEFERIDGNNVKGLAALDPDTGRVDWSWRTRVSGGSPAVVRAFDLEGDELYVGGSFTHVGLDGTRVAQARAARVSASTGAVDTSFRPIIQGGSVWDIATSKTNNDTYIVGSFTSVNVTPQTRHAARISRTGQISGSWRHELNHDYAEWTQVVETTPQGLVFLGGSQHILNAHRESDMALLWHHFTNPWGGDYQAIEYDASTGRVYASCHCYNFHWSRDDGGVNGIWQGGSPAPTGIQTEVDWVIAYDGTSGAKIDAFAPDFSGRAGPWALHVADNGCVWVGGGITGTNGKPQKGLTKICDPALLDSVRPTTPSRLVASNPTDSTVDLTWRGSTDNVGVTLYEVYRLDTGRVEATSTSPSVTVDGLAAGSIDLYVRARDADGNRSWRTNVVTAVLTGEDRTRPTTPRGLNVTSRAGGQVALEWLPASDNIAVVGYEVIDTATWTVIADTAGLTATVAGQDGRVLAVRAYDAAGNRSWRSNTQTG